MTKAQAALSGNKSLEWWWTPAAAVFFAIQLSDVLLFGWGVYDHYTSWSVTFVAVFFLGAVLWPVGALYAWHAAVVNTHFVLATITIIIFYEPAHFMAISRDTGAWLAWSGHIALHAVPVFLLTHYTLVNREAVRTHMRTLPLWAFFTTIALSAGPIILYSETMHPAARYGTTLSPGIAYGVMGGFVLLAGSARYIIK